MGLAVSLLGGGLSAWLAEGLALESSPSLPPDSDCIDFLFFVHDRHDGNRAAARQYLAWEVQLVAQLDALELQSFNFQH
jgi:3-mercaptopyruvate sulfurtransferase SseA